MEIVWQFLFKKLYIVLSDSAIPLLEVYTEENGKRILEDVFTTVYSSSNHNSQGGSNPSVHRIDKTWSIHTAEYFSAIEGNEALAQAATRVNLKYMMLSERGQSQEATYCTIPFL